MVGRTARRIGRRISGAVRSYGEYKKRNMQAKGRLAGKLAAHTVRAKTRSLRMVARGASKIYKNTSNVLSGKARVYAYGKRIL